MAKIRVHELAKELNLTNKAILTKLKAMNIEVKSHMSSLEDETVEHIKLNIFGNKQKEQESKTATSVIRRRKKTNTPSPHPETRRAEQPLSQPSPERADREQEKTIAKKSANERIAKPDTIDSNTLRLSADNRETTKQENSLKEKSSLEQPLSVEKEQVVKRDIVPDKDENTANAIEDSKQKIVRSVENSTNENNERLAVSQNDASQDTGKSIELDNNKKIEGFNIKESDMPRKPEKQVISKEETNTQESSKNSSDEIVLTEKVEHSEEEQTQAKTVNEETSDLIQDSDGSFNNNDKKKRRKKKQKKSEPAKIIKLAPPVQPTIVVASEPKKREHFEKTPSSDKDKISHQKEKPVYDKERPSFEKDKTLSYNRGERTERTGSETPNSNYRGKPSFDKDKVSSNRDKFSSDRDKSANAPIAKIEGKSEVPFSKIRNKKEPVIDIPFIPVEPSEKDDAKSKRKKSKVKKKKWGEEDDALSNDASSGQKKRKSVVEGKDLYDQTFLARKGRKKDSKNKQRPKPQQKTQITVPKAIKRRIKIEDTIDLSELAKRMSIKANEMIQKLMGMGIMVTVNQTIDFDTAALVAAEFDYEVEKAAVAEDILSYANEADDPDKLIPRSPVVTIMGHVDHGKTSLLDVIRKSKIVTGEAGGITQHIGAYSVQTPNGGIVTFLDTPGHAAFTSMRSRGAKITDIVVLVVAADDGVMPQTVEAINHSKAAGVPVVVAVNKIDKPDADPDRVMRELSDHGLLAEDWGGDVIFAKVSAKKRQGIDELLDLILLQAEILELKANPNRLAKGHVVEARLDAGRGPVATVLVQQGTLKIGQPVVCGLHSGKIRIMSDDMGKNIDAAGPSTPVEIVGLSGVPEAGDEFIALESEKDAKNISESRMQKERAKELAKKSRANLEKLFANMGSGETKQLKLIIKADVHGSLEALNESLIKLSQEEVDIKIVHSGTGAINESDVSLAAVSDAIIIGFNVRPTPKVREMAKDENVDMRFYDIIYNVINDIKTALTGLMPSTFHEIIIGRAEVRDIFVIPGKGTIAGSFVQDGKVSRGEKIRILRDGVIKCDSTLSSLRRFKDDAKEVNQGYECGIGIERFNDIKVGDIIECYQVEERKASIESLKESTASPAENE